MNRIQIIVAVVFIMASGFLPQMTIAQAPEKISYQLVIRNSSDQLVVNKQVGIRISIQKYVFGLPPSYQNVYIETHKPTTNANGLVSIQIGGGTIVAGVFKDINWGSGTYYIQTETDPAGGTSYTITGKTQILSVPYAIQAKTVESIQTDTSLDGNGNTAQPLKLAQQSATNGQVLKWNGTTWKPGAVTSLGTGNVNLQKLQAYIFRTGGSSPLRITSQELGLASASDLQKLFIINLEVGWNPNAGAIDPKEYRSLKDGIYYEIGLPGSDFMGIKVYFPDKLEYWLQNGRILYMLAE